MPEHRDADDLVVALTDMWGGYEPTREPITRLLAHGDGPNSDDLVDADIVVHSVFGREHARARVITVGVSGETLFSSLSDFTIDCRHNPAPSHFRLPTWAWSLLISELGQKTATTDHPVSEGVPIADRRFCNFIFGNPRCHTRNAFFEILHAKLPVDSLGKVYKNASDASLSSGEVAGWRESKLGVLGKYKFTIAFENREFVGYTTEKLVDAWLADTVPIYWGNPAFVVDFPDDACLSLYQAGSMARLVEQVLEAHHDAERYEQLRSRNPFRTGEGQAALERYRTGLVPFAESIRAAAFEHRSRRRRFGRREAKRLAVRLAGRPLSRVAARVNTLDLHRDK